MIALKSESLVTQIQENDQLVRNVRNFILAKVLPATNHVHVEADRGIVTLRGRVSSFYLKQLWLSGTQRVAGVRRVIDEIDVVDSYRRA